MKKALLIFCSILIASWVSAQDFISIYMDDHDADTNLSVVTISPKMMEEIMNRNSDEKSDIMNIISNLKSMRAVYSAENGSRYFNEALRKIEENKKRFDLYTAYTTDDEDLRIVVRKSKKQIVEMVMLLQLGDGFTVVSITGDIKPEYISALAGTITHEKEL